MPEPVRDPINHHPRHAALHRSNPGPTTRVSIRRIVVAGAVAVCLGLITTGSSASTPSAAKRQARTSGFVGASPLELKVHSLAELSRGAPEGAKLLPFTPITVAKPAPATPAIIGGLAANGIPNVALNAYRVAAARMSSASPGCGIDWSLLAGIGRIESNHGQYGGATLASNGDSTPHIIGEALDGVNWDYITDTDGGRYDGDTRFDHAVGPMQFIPSTWAIYGTDANGDGVADPFNINDAALAAARYLCTAGGDLRTADGQTRAVLAYNHNDEYLAMVLAIAAAYASGVPVDGPIVGITTGGLPPVDTSWIPPVNPAGPLAMTAPESTSSEHAGTAPRKASSKPGAAKPGTSKPGGSQQPAPGSTTGSGTTTGGTNPVTTPAPTPGIPNQPVQLPLPTTVPLPSQVAVPVNGATNTLCTVTGALGLPVQVPCPAPTPHP
jgi:membrane-bound lytic murein transglycosylase B